MFTGLWRWAPFNAGVDHRQMIRRVLIGLAVLVLMLSPLAMPEDVRLPGSPPAGNHRS